MEIEAYDPGGPLVSMKLWIAKTNRSRQILIMPRPRITRAWLCRAGQKRERSELFNAATLDKKFAGAWANCGMVLHYLGQEDKSQITFSAARARGYNRTAVYFQASTLPSALLDGRAKKSKNLNVATAILIFFMLSLSLRRKM